MNPNGASIAIKGCDMLTIRDGKIVENHAYLNGTEMARQLGAMPPAGSAAEKGMVGAFNAKTAVAKARPAPPRPLRGSLSDGQASSDLAHAGRRSGPRHLCVSTASWRCAGRRVRRRQRRRALAAPASDRVLVERIDEHARLGRDELGRAADRGRDHAALHRHALERRLAEGLGQRGLAEHVRGRDPAGTSACGMRPTTRTPGPALELGREGGRRRRTRAGRARAGRRRRRAGSRSCDRSASRRRRRPGPSPSQPSCRRAGSAGSGEKAPRSMPQSAIEIFGPAAGIRSLRRLGEPARVRDHRRRAPNDDPRGSRRRPRGSRRGWRRPDRGPSPPSAPARRARRARRRSPPGKRKWAKTTSGRKRRADATASAQSRAYLVGEPPRSADRGDLDPCPRRSSSSRIGTRKLPRSGFSGLGHIWVTSRMRIAPDHCGREGRRRSVVRRGDHEPRHGPPLIAVVPNRGEEQLIEVEVTMRGEVPAEAREHAEEKIGSLDRLAGQPDHAGAGGPHRGGQPADRAGLTGGGRDRSERADRPRQRRRHRADRRDQPTRPAARASAAPLGRSAQRPRPPRQASALPESGVTPTSPIARPDHFPRPPEEREVVRQKSFATHAARPRPKPPTRWRTSTTTSICSPRSRGVPTPSPTTATTAGSA